MRLIVMTKPTFFVEEDKILATLFDAGLSLLHVNKPNAEPLYSERLLSLLPEDDYKKIVTHQHFYLKEEYGLRGIHMDDACNAPLHYRGKQSATCNDLTVLKDMKKRFDYVLLAGAFAPVTAGAGSFGMAQLENAAKSGLIDKHVYAYGGVTTDNMAIAKHLGFGGVVVGDELWDTFDIHNEKDFSELIENFAKMQKAAD